MRKLNLLLLTAIFSLGIAGCDNSTEIVRGEFAEGVIIINEGNFSEVNGTIGFYNSTSKESSQDIFDQANGVSPGGLIQSVYFYENLAFIIDQVGNRIEVVEAETFKSVATIETGLNTPRYMVVANGKGYVSNWGDFDANFNLPESYVAVIDLTNYVVTKEIKTDNGSEGMLVFGDNVYVANSNSNTIEIIGTNNDAIAGSIVVPSSPISLLEDKNGKAWVLSSEFFGESALAQLDLTTERVMKSFLIGGSAKGFSSNGAKDQIYYLSTPFGSDAEVKKVSIEATEDAADALITASNLYGLGVDPTTGLIYLGNHNGFQGNGTVIRYEGGTLLDSFAAGIAPNGFVFRQ
jgi:DNA-binding beta-propeller fold protein YncE